jgi:hypothetical protein
VRFGTVARNDAVDPLAPRPRAHHACIAGEVGTLDRRQADPRRIDQARKLRRQPDRHAAAGLRQRLQGFPLVVGRQYLAAGLPCVGIGDVRRLDDRGDVDGRQRHADAEHPLAFWKRPSA